MAFDFTTFFTGLMGFISQLMNGLIDIIRVIAKVIPGPDEFKLIVASVILAYATARSKIAQSVVIFVIFMSIIYFVILKGGT